MGVAPLKGAYTAYSKVINFRSCASSLIGHINDAVFSFERAVAHDFASQDRSFLLADVIPPEKKNYLGRLPSICRALEVSSPVAVRELAELHL